MSGVNRVILVGNLGKDPEIRTLEGGTKVANFPLATSETFKNKNGEKTEHTEWHNIVLWRGLAEIAEKFLKKGKTIYIEGRLRTRSWEDSSGNKRYTTEIVADNMTMLGGRKDEGAEANNGATRENEPLLPDPADVTNDTADDLPF
jgi:single-strand DNA-binding protein